MNALEKARESTTTQDRTQTVYDERRTPCGECEAEYDTEAKIWTITRRCPPNCYCDVGSTGYLSCEPVGGGGYHRAADLKGLYISYFHPGSGTSIARVLIENIPWSTDTIPWMNGQVSDEAGKNIAYEIKLQRLREAVRDVTPTPIFPPLPSFERVVFGVAEATGLVRYGSLYVPLGVSPDTSEFVFNYGASRDNYVLRVKLDRDNSGDKLHQCATKPKKTASPCKGCEQMQLDIEALKRQMNEVTSRPAPIA